MPYPLADIAAMRHFFAILALAGLACGPAGAVPVPLQRPRPPVWSQPRSFAEAVAGLNFNAADVSAVPTACDRRLSAIAEIKPLPRLIGPGACGGGDMVELKSGRLPGQGPVAIAPAPVLRCAMAAELAGWVRDAAVPDVHAAGAVLRTVDTYDDYECRSRNRVPGAKLSEHG